MSQINYSLHCPYQQLHKLGKISSFLISPCMRQCLMAVSYERDAASHLHHSGMSLFPVIRLMRFY